MTECFGNMKEGCLVVFESHRNLPGGRLFWLRSVSIRKSDCEVVKGVPGVHKIPDMSEEISMCGTVASLV